MCVGEPIVKAAIHRCSNATQIFVQMYMYIAIVLSTSTALQSYSCTVIGVPISCKKK